MVTKSKYTLVVENLSSQTRSADVRCADRFVQLTGYQSKVYLPLASIFSKFPAALVRILSVRCGRPLALLGRDPLQRLNLTQSLCFDRKVFDKVCGDVRDCERDYKARSALVEMKRYTTVQLPSTPSAEGSSTGSTVLRCSAYERRLCFFYHLSSGDALLLLFAKLVSRSLLSAAFPAFLTTKMVGVACLLAQRAQSHETLRQAPLPPEPRLCNTSLLLLEDLQECKRT